MVWRGWFPIVGCYFRPTVLLLPVFWASLLFVTRRFSSRRICQALIVMLVPLILLLSPWWVRNYIVFDRFIPTYAGFWMATWQGLGEYANPVGAVLEERWFTSNTWMRVVLTPTSLRDLPILFSSQSPQGDPR